VGSLFFSYQVTWAKNLLTDAEAASLAPQRIKSVHGFLGRSSTSSIDKIHGDLSTLTDMVAQVAISLAKRLDEGGTPVTSAWHRLQLLRTNTNQI
jgi:hypothetical protein